MDVTFSDDQELLRKSAREFLIDQCPTSLVREVMDQGPATKGAEALWKKIAELGWMGLALDESHGGLGLGLVDNAILAEEMGRSLLPVPWFSTVCLAAEAIRVVGNEEQKNEWLPKIASGEIKATLAFLEPDAKLGSDGIRASAEAAGKGYRLEGTKAFVPDASTADLVLIVAQLEGKPAIFISGGEGIKTTEEPTLDQTRRLSRIDLSGVEIGGDALLGGAACGYAVVAHCLDRATAILCAEMCGGSQKVLELAVDYAKNREQFGRPIGSFQGVSHRCADMLLQIESARSLTYYAAWCCEQDEDQAPIATSSAKAAASDTYRSCTAQAIQVHGGIGFTWEADLHLWYRRSFWGSAMLGDAVHHRERVASLLNL